MGSGGGELPAASSCSSPQAAEPGALYARLWWHLGEALGRALDRRRRLRRQLWRGVRPIRARLLAAPVVVIDSSDEGEPAPEVTGCERR